MSTKFADIATMVWVLFVLCALHCRGEGALYCASP